MIVKASPFMLGEKRMMDEIKQEQQKDRKGVCAMLPREDRKRVTIEGVKPEVDGGRFPIKRVVGEKIIVEADIFADSHDSLAAILKFRKDGNPQWAEFPMECLVNDRWRGSFVVIEMGRFLYTVEAWVDRFRTWKGNLAKKVAAGQDVSVEILMGVEFVKDAVARAGDADRRKLTEWVVRLERQSHTALDPGLFMLMDEELMPVMQKNPDRRFATVYEKELAVVGDRPKARFSSWYEMFPRSCGRKPGKHGTFKDCEARLSYVSQMGFDVLYLPPVHPIGRTNRKGKNNQPVALPEDTGSPWAIGAPEGGHKSIHPQLGTLEEFREFAAKAQEQGLEIALDIAFQCTPDHPYVKEHPEWFRWRPDNTIQYAENPPKKYEDIYPINFETENWQELWAELKDVMVFWIHQGVKIFRVDNPHTKSFQFWEWAIEEIKKEYPEVLFLAEAFTRPKVMYRLAKLGFSQSYTYFAWRNTKWEITQYFAELCQTDVREFFRPSLWPNTPDILTEYLQMGGRPAFVTRLVLAATLGASYGIYGPAFELCENHAKEYGSEEYLDSEKYQIRVWDIERSDSLRHIIGRVNRIRKENPALQSDRSLRFHPVDNEQIICYTKTTQDLSNIILVVVNLDPHHVHSGWLSLPLVDLGIDEDKPYQVHDLLSDTRYLWNGPRNYVEINPQMVSGHIFRLRRRVRTERDFDYFM
jgi:starch synthase (maltosyl-transferring)